MSGDVRPIAREAKAIKRRHAELLAGEPSFRETSGQRDALAALDAARDRLRGGERPVAPQMTLDVRSR